MIGNPIDPGGNLPLDLGFDHWYHQWLILATTKAITHNPTIQNKLMLLCLEQCIRWSYIDDESSMKHVLPITWIEESDKLLARLNKKCESCVFLLLIFLRLFTGFHIEDVM